MMNGPLSKLAPCSEDVERYQISSTFILLTLVERQAGKEPKNLDRTDRWNMQTHHTKVPHTWYRH